MKNIHVLPTDNPSRLLKTIPKGNLILSKLITSGSHWENQNIYITSDEEINLNDYITDGYRVWKWKDDSSLLGRKKIILTTDQELIKDGVQSIDDEFLNWFVKNPSCESVELEVDLSKHNGQFQTKYGWKIIIPQEEPKQETLEEFIEREGYPDGHTQDIWEDGVRRGINWQQEQILQFLYSEITERRPYSSSKMCEEVIKFIEQLNNKK
jgi:hypothetical protein